MLMLLHQTPYAMLTFVILMTSCIEGRLLLDELFLDLDKKGLVAADTVVYSGCSAGALTTYAHLVRCF